MAVEIPVVVDVLGGAQRAVKDIPQVVQMMQQKIDENVLEIPVEINRKGDLKEVLDFVGTTKLSMADLKYAIKSASSELARLKRTGASNEDVEKYAQAVILLKQIREQWKLNERFASQIGDDELRNLQIQQQYNEALQISASTLNNINAKIAGYTAMLNNSDIGSAKFEEAAIQLGKMSRQLQTVQANVKILGTHFGSIDQLNAKLQLANQYWNQLASSRKFNADGKLTAEASALLADYKKLTAELKTQGISMADLVAKEQQRIQKHQQYLTNRKKENAILNTTVKTVDALQAKINVLQSRLNRTEVGTRAFANLNKQLKQAQQDLAMVQQRMSNAGIEAEKMDATFSRLLKRSLYFFGLSAITRFVRNVRQVTAEFELQRVALGGIIQDTEQANTLFRQIKAAAIESPFEIKDLVSYTKQLSAYRVETENLFDVTMRLADVSAGLGVDMSRLILAYGQVRAASVLRGQELRQFTEAGIPLVDLLAKKFHELNGRMVSTGEVFEMISKRAVPFEMISEIFEDMTSKGGTFYKMQEKQAETLAGQWANLKDAVSIMYDEIGNTDTVHRAMEGIITDAKTLMQNWRSVATILKTVGIQYALVKVASLFLPTLTMNTKLAEKATIALARAQQLETAQQAKSNVVRGLAISQLNKYSKYMAKAAAAQTLFGRGLNKIAASFLGGGWVGLAITAVSVLVGWFISARQEANRLNKELDKIGTEGAIQINRSVANFRRLAEAAVEAADGSNEQNEALAELQRTYSDIIPSQNMQIDKLRELKGNYDSLTEAIEQKINMQIREQKVNAATDAYSKDIQKGRKNTKNLLLQYGLDKEQINAVMEEVQKAVDKGLIGVNSTAEEKTQLFAKIIKDLTGIVVDFGNGFRDYEGNWVRVSDTNDKALKSLEKLTDIYLDLHSEIDDINNEMESSVGTMGVYAKAWEDLQKEIKGVTVSEEQFGDKFTFTFKKEKVRRQVELIAEAIEDAFEGTNIDISKAFDPKGTINFEFLNKAAAGSKRWGLQSFIKHVQESYEAVVPTNRMVSVVERKFEELAKAVGLSMDDVQGYLLRGEKDMKDYAKEIASDLEEAKYKVIDFQKQAEDFAKHPGVALPISDEDVENANAMVKFLTLLSEWLAEYAKQTRSGSHQTDPWITNMQERMKFMQDFKKGYDDLKKYMSSTSALGEEAGIMFGRGSALGLSAADQERAAENLSDWYEDMIKATSERLRGKGLAGATVTDLLGIDTTTRSKDIQELQKLLQSLWDAKTDFDISQKKKDFDDALKLLTDEIKRSETARDFYKNILDLTGDEELAATMGVSVYGGIGGDFKERMQQQLNQALGSLDASAMTDELRDAFANQDFATILANLDKFPTEWQDIIKRMASDNEKFTADWVTDIIKTYQKTKTYEERISDVHKKEEQKRKEISESTALTDDQKATYTAASQKKEAEEIADIELERLKSTYEWTQAFKDLERVSTETLEELIKLLDEYIEKSGPSASPEALKAATQAREQAQEQIVVRDAYSKAVDGIKRYVAAKKEANKLEKEGKKNTQEYRKAQDQARDALKDAEKAVQEIGNSFNTLSSIVSSVSDILDLDELSDGRAVLQGIASGLTLVGTALVFINAMFTLLETNPVVLAISAIIAGVAALASILSNLSVAKANREIKRQQELIEELEYSYDRLEKAIAKAFGSDYIYNYNKQMENLVAQQAAYEKQAELERGKGKKADEEKIKDYENSARDAADQIVDMRSQLSEFFTGTDLTSAASDFANAWIDAYKEFGSTTDAMKEKFNDMVQSMITQSIGAKIMQSILQPLFDEIDEMAQTGGELSAQEIADIATMAPQYIEQINAAMTGLMNQLGAAGYNMRQQVGGFTGISRDIAGASEESINGLAAGINTQNFYMSLISQNVAAILAAMTGETVEGATGAAVPDPYKEQMLGFVGRIPTIEQHLFDIKTMLADVIKPSTAPINRVVHTFIH
ncbi:MAG: hypothetical protein J6T35_02565 [Bacteroidales bacterium]|nr:hypothetical protein [Bacteroidales bacterium]